VLGRQVEMMERRRQLNYKLRVHSVPEDLRLPLSHGREHLAEAAALYRMAVESRRLWDVWLARCALDRPHPEVGRRHVPDDPVRALRGVPGGSLGDSTRLAH
jgi:hypothetical protein